MSLILACQKLTLDIVYKVAKHSITHFFSLTMTLSFIPLSICYTTKENFAAYTYFRMKYVYFYTGHMVKMAFTCTCNVLSSEIKYFHIYKELSCLFSVLSPSINICFQFIQCFYNLFNKYMYF